MQNPPEAPPSKLRNSAPPLQFKVLLCLSDWRKETVLFRHLLTSQTFLDDPLRVLRSVRFASRLAYHLADDIPLAASDSAVSSWGVQMSQSLWGCRCHRFMGVQVIVCRELFPSSHSMGLVKHNNNTGNIHILFLPSPFLTCSRWGMPFPRRFRGSGSAKKSRVCVVGQHGYHPVSD